MFSSNQDTPRIVRGSNPLDQSVYQTRDLRSIMPLEVGANPAFQVPAYGTRPLPLIAIEEYNEQVARNEVVLTRSLAKQMSVYFHKLPAFRYAQQPFIPQQPGNVRTIPMGTNSYGTNMTPGVANISQYTQDTNTLSM